MRKFLVLILFLISFNSFAIIGADTAMMVQLVTNTANQINELEKLVSNTEKYTKRMREYNELAEDHYFRGERVLYLAESLATKSNIENLGELNGAIRNLKYNMGDLKELMKDYSKIKSDEKRTEVYVAENKKLNELSKKTAQTQVANSMKASSTGRAGQLTAQNTALIFENQLKMQEVQLEILKTQKTANRLKAEELEDKRLEEMNRLKFYGRKTTDNH
jgi:hypothetical protein